MGLTPPGIGRALAQQKEFSRLPVDILRSCAHAASEGQAGVTSNMAAYRIYKIALDSTNNGIAPSYFDY